MGCSLVVDDGAVIIYGEWHRGHRGHLRGQYYSTMGIKVTEVTWGFQSKSFSTSNTDTSHGNDPYDCVGVWRECVYVGVGMCVVCVCGRVERECVWV